MQDIKYPDESFDLILSHHVLEHVEDDIKALSEINRVLKDNGKFYFSVPVNWRNKTREYGFADPKNHYHYREYGFDITDKFSSYIWKQIKLSDLLEKSMIKQYGLNPDEPIFELKKQG